MGARLEPAPNADDSVEFLDAGGHKQFTVWINSMPSSEYQPYEAYVVHLEEHFGGAAVVGIRAYDDMVAEYDNLIGLLTAEGSAYPDTVKRVTAQLLTLLENFVLLSRTPTPPEPDDG